MDSIALGVNRCQNRSVPMSTQAKTVFTPEEYLELERRAEYKSEYYKGQIFAMSGGSRWHARIETQLLLLVGQHLRGQRCEMFSDNMRVLAVASGLYTYPDLSVACEEPQFADQHVDTLTNPTLVAEILSPSTENYDRGNKAKLYREIPSLRELLIVSQDTYEVELYRRQPDGSWSLFAAKGLNAAIELQSIGYTLQLRELYEKVFPRRQESDLSEGPQEAH
jgi:Uma2 family endonuclease